MEEAEGFEILSRSLLLSKRGARPIELSVAQQLHMCLYWEYGDNRGKMAMSQKARGWASLTKTKADRLLKQLIGNPPTLRTASLPATSQRTRFRESKLLDGHKASPIVDAMPHCAILQVFITKTCSLPEEVAASLF